MPTYEYKCEKCGHMFEIIQKITEDPLKFCPECKGMIKRLISAAGIVFKGSGFHVTDYGKKEIREPKSAETKLAKAKTEKAASTETAPPKLVEKKEAKSKEI